ncbi:helicase domain protein (plasmid) [Halalkalicoccus jeotgali B3]|uniref:Helicase domain protein n=1 Tax=Halalkalicoccus jeotgali (strain DSM 18796 / CECT 7217 / JCM 14584 / KCTC 4019 / B3) TaxID=795797 RepID=D8JCQ6_HALJB|nr:helicase-related protein [Halalkalicoccus jeotgali]ADJ16801.1 helicase domain protein [Halalkalicoccus jeotgali B3]ADJ17195.1 helicase domain protein [Halalkalicoccus jeotgali B3]
MTDYAVGDHVKFAGGQGEITKIEDRPNGGQLLHVYTTEGQLRKLPGGLPHIERIDSIVDRLAAKQVDDPLHHDLREHATRLDLAYRYDRFLSLTNNRIEIEPYQVQAAYEILNSYDHRYLVGDEVGLGKTIEAGIVIEELIARGRAERVLIVAPAPLAVQWQEELREKFDRNFVLYDRNTVQAYRQSHPNQNVWQQEDRIITSIDFAKQDDVLEALRNLEEEWDIAVFDEAHHLTARRSSDDSTERTQRYMVGEAVANNSDALLLLTGTPHKGKSDQFYHLVSLLDPYRFSHESQITPEGLEDLMIRRLKDDMYETDGTRMFPEKNIEALPVEMTPEERELYNNVTEYIREYYNLAQNEENQAAGFTMVIYQKRLVSSIHAIRKSLENRMRAIQNDAVAEDLPDDVQELIPRYSTEPETLTDAERARVEEALEHVTITLNRSQIDAELGRVKQLWRQAKAIETDSKAELLREFVERILAEDPDEKILIFTEYTDTLKYLRDTVFPEHDIAQVYGDLEQERRRREMEKFENEANLMLATDAAQEGLNLQFAHIMVNYDLPWNPIRIDQRMGRLHRYGQDRTVEIRNLFFDNTRESDILELLLEKTDQIEADLGMRSDVLGRILENVDLDETIMAAIAEGRPTEEVVADIEATIEERKEALETVENDFLIRDRFDLSDEDREILEIIERSRHGEVGEADIEALVREFFDEFGGTIKGVRPGPARSSGDIFRLEVPNVLTGDQIKSHYDTATFTKDVAMEEDEVDFIALDHPLVQSLIDYCLDSNRVQGQIAVKVASNPEVTSGILFNYRLGYVSGTGDAITEKFVRLYATREGTITAEIPEFVETLSPNDSVVNSCTTLDQLASKASQLHDVAEARAWDEVESFADEARTEREREIGIKREHAERYFTDQIEEWEERLETYQQRAEQGTDMSAPIGNAQRELEQLRRQRDKELSQLEEEQHVTPEEPELVTAAFVISPEMRW